PQRQPASAAEQVLLPKRTVTAASVSFEMPALAPAQRAESEPLAAPSSRRPWMLGAAAAGAIAIAAFLALQGNARSPAPALPAVQVLGGQGAPIAAPSPTDAGLDAAESDGVE